MSDDAEVFPLPPDGVRRHSLPPSAEIGARLEDLLDEVAALKQLHRAALRAEEGRRMRKLREGPPGP